MNTYNVKCPICGVVNHSLFLEETDGWMECEACFGIARVYQINQDQSILLYTAKKINPMPKTTVPAI